MSSRKQREARGGDFVRKVKAALVGMGGAVVASPAYAEWTSLVSGTDFDGIKGDVGTCAAGIISVCLIVLGIGILMRALGR